MATHYTPDGYHTATPYLTIDGATRAIDFYKQVFGATELFRIDAPEGKIGHAEIRIGDSILMLADEFPQVGNRSPHALGGSPVGLMIYVPNVDEMFSQAVAAGAQVMRPVQDQFYGDRSGTVTDPFGHIWTISTHIEDVTPEEMLRRAEAFAKQQPPA